MEQVTQFILQLREDYINNHLAGSYEEINCGRCVDFAEEVEYEISNCTALSNDHFINEREDLDAWNGDEHDIWSEESLKEYDSLPPGDITIADLTNKIRGYHCWIYCEGKHYDAECPEGVKNFFELPFFKRHLEETDKLLNNE